MLTIHPCVLTILARSVDNEWNGGVVNMPEATSRAAAIRRFIVEQVADHPSDIARIAAEAFGVTRQAVNRQMQRLEADGLLEHTGNTRARTYRLAAAHTHRWSYSLAAGLVEDRPWMEDLRPVLADLAGNVLQIWHYGFTEMFNNAIEHSEGSEITAAVARSITSTTVTIHDDGVGIFRKIAQALKLADERQAPLELAKGKFTTDPARHSGEGVFFTSRMFDRFAIISGAVIFSHESDDPADWVLDRDVPASGTVVIMTLANDSERTTKSVFDRFASADDYSFDKTVVPVRLAEYGDDALVSRSQARRLLARFERFRTVVLDFRGVDEIGQSFADELFRVFAAEHPEVEIVEFRANEAVQRMIARARAYR